MKTCKECQFHGEVEYKDQYVRVICANCTQCTDWHDMTEDVTCMFDAEQGAWLSWNRINK